MDQVLEGVRSEERRIIDLGFGVSNSFLYVGPI